MSRRFSHLSLEQRRLIAKLTEAKAPVVLIAARIGCHPSTVCRERKRNHFEDDAWPAGRGYYAVAAHGMAAGRRKRLGKLYRHADLASFVAERLRAAWSPEQIAGFLRYRSAAGVRLCHETVYRWVYGAEGRSVDTYEFADGRLDVRFKGVSLAYRTFDKDQRVTHAAIVENKRLTEVLTWVKARQDEPRPVAVKSASE